MKLHFPDGKGGMNTIEVSDNISLYIENLLEDWTLETASESVKGGIKVGDGLYMTGDSLNAKQYTLFPASKDNLGGVSIGDGLNIDSDGVVSADVYELAIATTENLGGVIIGDGLTIDSAGVVSTNIYDLPTASETVKGGIMVGEGLYMDGDSLNASVSGGGDTYYVVEGGEGVVSLQPAYIENPYELPIANKTRLGGIKVGNGLTMTGESLNADAYELPTASNVTKGGIKIGTGLYMRGDSLNAYSSGGGSTSTYTLRTATRYIKGGIKVGNGLAMNCEVLNVTLQGANEDWELPIATRNQLGGVIVGQGLDISENGVFSCNISYSEMESLTAEFSDEEETTINSKGSNVIVLAADEAFDPRDHQWYCFYRSNYEYEIIPKLPSGVPIINVTDTDGGNFVLPTEYMDLEFVVRGDDNKLVSVFGNLYNESEAKYHRNLATKKQLKDGKCVVPFDAKILNNALSQGKIVAEYGIVSEMGNVVLKGTVSTLPESPKHGWLCYNSTDNKFHIYDGTAKKWRSWICTV